MAQKEPDLLLVVEHSVDPGQKIHVLKPSFPEAQQGVSPYLLQVASCPAEFTRPAGARSTHMGVDQARFMSSWMTLTW